MSKKQSGFFGTRCSLLVQSGICDVKALHKVLNYKIVMAALHSRCEHSILPLWFLLLPSSYFPRLFSAVVHWMSATLPRMMWP